MTYTKSVNVNAITTHLAAMADVLYTTMRLKYEIVGGHQSEKLNSFEKTTVGGKLDR